MSQGPPLLFKFSRRGTRVDPIRSSLVDTRPLAAFASSAPSNLIASIITHFNVSQEVGILLISVFVAGCVWSFRDCTSRLEQAD